MDNQTLMPDSNRPIARVVTGQKMVLYAIVLWLATPILWGAASQLFQEWNGPLILVLAVAPYLLGLFGLLRLWSGLGYSELTKLFLLLLLFIPVINVLVLLLINGRATRALRTAGYKIGLLGARGTPSVHQEGNAI